MYWNASTPLLKLGGVLARKKSEQAGWFLLRYWLEGTTPPSLTLGHPSYKLRRGVAPYIGLQLIDKPQGFLVHAVS